MSRLLRLYQSKNLMEKNIERQLIESLTKHYRQDVSTYTRCLEQVSYSDSNTRERVNI